MELSNPMNKSIESEVEKFKKAPLMHLLDSKEYKTLWVSKNEVAVWLRTALERVRREAIEECMTALDKVHVMAEGNGAYVVPKALVFDALQTLLQNHE